MPEGDNNVEVKAVPQILTDSPDKANISRNEKSPQIVDKGPYKLVQKFFSGDKKAGFSYFVIEYKNGSDQEANASIEMMLKKNGWSAGKIVDLVNTSIVGALRAKATNALLFDGTEEEVAIETARLQKDEPCLVTPQQAEDYIPGERDARSVAGKLKLIQDYVKEISDKDQPVAADRKDYLLKEMFRIRMEIVADLEKQSRVLESTVAS